MTKSRILDRKNYAKCMNIYEQFSQIVAAKPEIEYAVPLGADIIIHEKSLRTKVYREHCVKTYGGTMRHDSECYGTERFWNAWSNTCEGFREKFGLRMSNEGSVENYLLSPSECAVMITEI